MSRAGILTLVVIVADGTLMWFGMQGLTDVECEVCVTWIDQTRCQTGQGCDEAAAVDRAQTAICQILSNGRADNITCGSKEPDSVECK